MTILLTIEIRLEHDVVLTRQRTRQIASLLGFESQDQTRIATAVSEITRNAFQYAKGGKVEFRVECESPQVFLISIRDRGSGIAELKTILDGRYKSQTGMGLGIIGSQRLMDRFEIESTPEQGTLVLMGKILPKRAAKVTAERLAQITNELMMRSRNESGELSPQTPFEEIQQQNQELLRALEELQKREEDLIQINRELEDTNRGVVALYAELDEKAESLQRANELKTRFLSNMSHEFRTPLNSIVSLSRILLDRMDGELTPEQEKQVTFIRKSAEELSELVNDLLDLAKVEAGKLTVYAKEFEVSDLFGALRGMLRPLLAYNSSISLTFEEPIGIPTLYTDEGKIAQILRNFISNALKYTEQGVVRISATLEGKSVVFSVADTGIGIAPEDQERIFEEFTQIDSRIQKQVKGTGLGLPLSRKLAELIGGSVSVESGVGKGSIFSATIPLVYGNGRERTFLPEVSWTLDSAAKTILVIEDNFETLFTYQKYFEGSIYQLVEARSLQEAKKALSVFKPQAMLLDILLEDQNSWAFLSEIKGNEATRDIPVVVATIIDNEKKARALGADAFFLKPVERLLLLNTFNYLVAEKEQPTLLIVDDDPIARYVLKQLLNNKGEGERCPYTLIEAADGREGIRLAQEANPQAIFLDLVMSEISGLEVLERLKSDSTTRNIPVIINTSKPLAEEERQYLAERTVAILSKQSPAPEVAIAKIQEALLKAGLVLGTPKEDYV